MHDKPRFSIFSVNKNNSNQFVFDLIKVYRKELYKRANGSTFKEVSKKEVEKIKVIIPSLPEQQKIASFLTDVDDAITQLTKKKTFLEQYKKGVMQKIFKQELRFKNDDGNDFVDWEVKQLREVANYRRGSFPQPYGLPKWYDKKNGIPFVQVYDVEDNMLLKPKTKHKISELGAKQSVFVEKGTLIITIQGSIGRITKT
ncbi:restriction endonuclease subunit S [Polaribacter litorisediminis]|uniref:restriction endonuclease subunit S n=1 Tax=Polaribacter litorisediminis TaxID=1908341 RepID=UPI0020C7E713|nr:restriction endonuclease subunit S [Polaribacter litorisediminis]UAM98305.1 restriction endonuclease subunit S [Polaribacter litorisediminis]